MRVLVRKPLIWMVVAECAVVGAVLIIAWHAITGGAAVGADASLSLPAATSAPADNALPASGVPVVGGNARGPAPGLNVGIAFWRVRLGSLNRDEAAFEALEWRITHAVMNAARDYLETVVLPAVKRAEKGGA